MQDHTPFDLDFKVQNAQTESTQNKENQKLICQVMSQIFSLRDQVQLAIRVMKQEPAYKASIKVTDNLEKKAF